MTRRTTIKGTKIASDEYGVTSIETSGGRKHVARKTPCEQCPWREDVPTGVFPAECIPAQRTHRLRCRHVHVRLPHGGRAASGHMCAGFLLRHGAHNLSVRIALSGERIDLDKISDGGFPIYETYRDMAVANGVDPDDLVLKPVRGNDEPAPNVWGTRYDE